MSEPTFYRQTPGPLTWEQELALAELQGAGVLVPVEPSILDQYLKRLRSRHES